jgi:hypothetical protein
MINIKAKALGALLLFLAAGCADLDVRNPNDPDRAKALATAEDVESLIAGSYATWFFITHDNDLLAVSTSSFQHSAPWANFGMVPISALPRPPLVNDAADQNYRMINLPWTNNYRALAAIADGLRAIDDPSTGIADGLGAAKVARLRAFGRFVQGLAHANLAVLYDKAFIVDETTDVTAEQEAVPATDVMAAAIGYFGDAIQIASAGGFPDIPAEWMSVVVTPAELARIASSMRAAYRISLPRTPAERSLIDWQAVLTDVANGVTSEFRLNNEYPRWYNSYLDYGTYPTWQQITYMIHGMADQSGDYQKWLAQPVSDRNAVVDGENILIVTPDERFPQGETLVEQGENPGTNIIVPSFTQHYRPDRGTWRWSWYHNVEWADYNSGDDETVPEIEMEEMDLIAAEAHYWLNQPAAAAALVNKTRVAAGLNATDASGTNTSCVPKLPNGACGDLLEMIKWEKRMEVWQTGIVYSLSWYFDARRWGDHYKGTFLEFPIPARELQVLSMPMYTFGGAEGTSSAPGSTYAWPNEQ